VKRILGVVVIATACARGEQTPAVRPLTAADVANATLRTEYAESTATITLTHGRYVSSDSSFQAMLLPDVVFGDLTGDTVSEALAVLVTEPGGSGSFYDLVVLGATPAGARQLAAAALGDRVDIESMMIADRQILVQLITQGPADPMCCPSRREARTYALVGDSLELVGTPVVISDSVQPDTGGTRP
jgi:hypothetical protein